MIGGVAGVALGAMAAVPAGAADDDCIAAVRKRVCCTGATIAHTRLPRQIGFTIAGYDCASGASFMSSGREVSGRAPDGRLYHASFDDEDVSTREEATHPRGHASGPTMVFPSIYVVDALARPEVVAGCTSNADGTFTLRLMYHAPAMPEIEREAFDYGMDLVIDDAGRVIKLVFPTTTSAFAYAADIPACAPAPATTIGDGPGRVVHAEYLSNDQVAARFEPKAVLDYVRLVNGEPRALADQIGTPAMQERNARMMTSEMALLVATPLAWRPTGWVPARIALLVGGVVVLITAVIARSVRR